MNKGKTERTARLCVYITEDLNDKLEILKNNLGTSKTLIVEKALSDLFEKKKKFLEKKSDEDRFFWDNKKYFLTVV